MFELMDAYSQSAVIKVIGVGGGGAAVATFFFAQAADPTEIAAARATSIH